MEGLRLWTRRRGRVSVGLFARECMDYINAN